MIVLSSVTNERIDAALNGADTARVVEELASFTQAVAGSSLLARALAQPDLPADAKRGLVGNVVQNRFSANAVDVIVAVAEDAKGGDLAARLFAALARAAFVGGDLTTVEQQLVALAEAIRTTPSLRDAFTNAGVSDAPKRAIAHDLLSVARPTTRALVETAIALDHGKNLDATLLELADDAAARRNVAVADIRTAVELDDDRRNRLVEALSRSVGRSVEGRFTVDPSVLGSVVVRLGDEVLDGSIRHRLDQARLALRQGA